MSVDVFERQLGKTSNDKRDLNGKRLCNVGQPVQPNDAVTLNVAHSMVQEEIRTLYYVTTSAQNTVDDNEAMFRALESDLQKGLRRLHAASASVQELLVRISEVISELDAKLRTLEG